MTRRRRRRKIRGHYCWCCGRQRPNERFSGRGHGRHVCKECAKLGNAELEYRQHVRDIDRLLTWEGRIRRKQRRSFEWYLEHPGERVRGYAEKVRAHDVQMREEFFALVRADEEEAERSAEFCAEQLATPEGHDALDDRDLPF